MDTRTRAQARRSRLYWRCTAALLGAVVLSIGCNPLASLAFILTPDRLEQPEYSLARPDKETRVAVAVMPYDHTGIQLPNVDHHLMEKLTRDLKERYKDYDPKVTFVQPMQVNTYLNRNRHIPDLSGKEIGKKLQADYVIKIELERMTLVDGVGGSMYSGRANMIVEMTDVNAVEGEGTVMWQHFECQYPKVGTFVERSDMSAQQFYGKFVARITRDLSQMFARYEPRDRYDSE